MDSVHDDKKDLLNVLAVNVQGIECYGRLDQVQILLVNNLVSVAVLTETETTHSIAESSNIEGFRAYCPPTCVIGPIGKEVGVMLMISNKLSSATKPRPDINGNDSIQTVWIELLNFDLIIGGVYRRARPCADLEKEEFLQLSNQILKAASSGKKVLVLGDVNIDHTNPNHKKAKEAKDLLSDMEAANMRRLPSFVPTWKSYGLHKICHCPTKPQSKNSFNCMICDVSFQLESELNLHIVSVHEGRKPFKCTTCKEQFEAEKKIEKSYKIGS